MPNLHSQILASSKCITLSDEGQQSISMICYFHQHNHSLDDFDGHVQDAAVIYAGDIPFQYSKKQGTYEEVLDNPTGSIFLAARRDHSFLLSHKDTA